MSASPSTIPAASPPWHLIHFDVHCARCGHDLHGQSEPVCPACRFEFTWQQAAPLEHLTCGQCNYHLNGLSDSRCPECGTTVDWNEALLRYHRRAKPLFEYRWRDRPIRSFFRTWSLACFPSNLWRKIGIHDPPQLLPLSAWLFLLLLASTISIPLGYSIGEYADHMLPIGGPLRSASSWQLLFYFAQGVLQSTLDGLSLDRPFVGGVAETYELIGLVALWWLFTFGSLLILRQSMNRCRVRTVHVFRVCAYSLLATVPLMALLAGVFQWDYTWLLSFGYVTNVLNKSAILLVLFFAHVIWALALGYSKYLKMPHGLGVAVASQLIAVPATLMVPTVLFWLRHWKELWAL